jgi:hypothetical protein
LFHVGETKATSGPKRMPVGSEVLLARPTIANRTRQYVEKVNVFVIAGSHSRLDKEISRGQTSHLRQTHLNK